MSNYGVAVWDVAEGLGLRGRNRIDVQFTIDKMGNVTNITTRAPHHKLENEAKRVMGKMPQLKPGKQNNKAVAVAYTVPIVIKMEY